MQRQRRLHFRQRQADQRDAPQGINRRGCEFHGM
jgi:hypothetical protein